MHSVHFHGQILTNLNHHTDIISLFPASSTTAEMVADNPGHWLLTCTVNDHLMGETMCSSLKIRLITFVRKFLSQEGHLVIIPAYFQDLYVFFLLQLECKLCLRSRNVTPMFISPVLMVSSDSSLLLLRRRSGTMLLRCPVTGLVILDSHTKVQTETMSIFLVRPARTEF